ncbi:N-acetylmuramoyl-L-alanine amidase [Enterococcus haemoperoxidus ATCC BAA-382]|uniref:Peptidoglycan hydrolase n=1 Tax=Enterococcus haemoperoxidus ATCC BAA-382 TaxID=1158608 RepID=R2STL9_9ENTE|nr:glucosaminidase domain-containing protein [Enterococcus haemoperoxidus]EOH98580.1 N-acetylmuramoyl-L-alanine amidase [Enterococcus haemoperoxidus ATCC BAA-382]EOT62237.1 N-acetylmuramoyl-L-alanine amidase [Enterococcus haemoperoxidus ATCC BAA-382]
MDEIKTRSSRHQQQNLKKNRKRVASVIGTSLVFLPIAGNLLPLGVQATEVETQGAISQQAFIDSIGYSAASVADVNDLYASVMIAQALLESSYGTSGLAAAPNYNLFGVKGSYGGQSVYMPTSEYLNGEWVTVTEPFRSYPSYAESFQDHANVLKTTLASSGNYHYSGVWKSNTSSYMDATAALAGRYATDPNYASKLNWLIEAYGLTAYDSGITQSTVTSDNAASTQSTIGQSSATNTVSTYTVASGDTLWGISEKFGISVDQLMASNGITAELITVGQVLQIA